MTRALRGPFSRLMLGGDDGTDEGTDHPDFPRGRGVLHVSVSLRLRGEGPNLGW